MPTPHGARASAEKVFGIDQTSSASTLIPHAPDVYASGLMVIYWRPEAAGVDITALDLLQSSPAGRADRPLTAISNIYAPLVPFVPPSPTRRRTVPIPSLHH